MPPTHFLWKNVAKCLQNWVQDAKNFLYFSPTFLRTFKLQHPARNFLKWIWHVSNQSLLLTMVLIRYSHPDAIVSRVHIVSIRGDLFLFDQTIHQLPAWKVDGVIIAHRLSHVTIQWMTCTVWTRRNHLGAAETSRLGILKIKSCSIVWVFSREECIVDLMIGYVGVEQLSLSLKVGADSIPITTL